MYQHQTSDGNNNKIKQPQHDQHPQDQPQQQHLHINWSNFKPEFSGKPDEDAEVHVLCSNDWMNAHHFDAKVQRFCLTLLGEARLWYHSLEPINVRMTRTAEFIQTDILKGRKYMGTTISCMEII